MTDTIATLFDAHANGKPLTATIEEMKTRTRFIRITSAGLRESHPHDVTITKDSPNYRTSW